jgi:hypothetical protein
MSNQNPSSEDGHVYQKYRPHGLPEKTSKAADGSAPSGPKSVPDRTEDQLYADYYRGKPNEKATEAGERSHIPHASQDAESNVAECGSDAEDEGATKSDKQSAHKNTIIIRPKRPGEDSGHVITGVLKVRNKDSREEK